MPEEMNPTPTNLTGNLSVDRTTDGKPTFTMIPNWVLDSGIVGQIGSTAFHVYVVRCRHTWVGAGLTWSQEKIAKLTGLSRQTISAADKTLMAHGLIKKGSSYKVGERGKAIWVVRDPGGPADSYCVKETGTIDCVKEAGTIEPKPKCRDSGTKCKESRHQVSKILASSVKETGTLLDSYKTITNKQEKRLVGSHVRKEQEGETLRGRYPQYDKAIDESIMPHLKSHLPQLAARVTFDMVYEQIRVYSSVNVNKAISLCNRKTFAWGGVLSNLKNMWKRPADQQLDRLRLATA